MAKGTESTLPLSMGVLCATLQRQYHAAVAGFDLHRTESGFSGYPASTCEHQRMNHLRHVRHHAAQLADKLCAHGGAGTRWVATRPIRQTPS